MDEWYFFEDDVLNAATYQKWRLLSVHELMGERDLIMKRLDGAWGYNEEVRRKLTLLLGKFDLYYESRVLAYRKELQEFQNNGKKNKD